MQPNEIFVNVWLDLGGWQFVWVRLVAPFDASRHAVLRAEALEFVNALENVLGYEIGEGYDFGKKPLDEDSDYELYPSMEAFQEKYPYWEHDIRPRS